MKSRFTNALTLFIGICFAVIAVVLGGFGSGESLATIAKVLFAPFFLDISRGVGEYLALAFRWVTLVSYSAVVGLVILRIRAKEKMPQIALSIFGILMTVVHFLIVGFGYGSTGLH